MHIRIYPLCSPPLFLTVCVSSSRQDELTDASLSSSPAPEAATATTTATDDAAFITAQDSSFFVGESQDDASSLYYKTDCHSKEELAGSYKYTTTGATPPELQAPPAGRTRHNGGSLLQLKAVNIRSQS